EIIRACQSLLIVGRHRVGKTSFCKMAIHQLMGSPANQVLATYLNLQHCPQLTIETFLEHTILNMMGEIARQVFQCKYSDLLRADPAGAHPQLRNDAEFGWFVNIFRQVTERTHSRDGVVPPPLHAHEFIHFTNELLEIVRSRNWRSLAIFYDEA